jgi:hypothetical protein
MKGEVQEVELEIKPFYFFRGLGRPVDRSLRAPFGAWRKRHDPPICQNRAQFDGLRRSQHPIPRASSHYRSQPNSTNKQPNLLRCATYLLRSLRHVRRSVCLTPHPSDRFTSTTPLREHGSGLIALYERGVAGPPHRPAAGVVAPVIPFETINDVRAPCLSSRIPCNEMKSARLRRFDHGLHPSSLIRFSRTADFGFSIRLNVR